MDCIFPTLLDGEAIRAIVERDNVELAHRMGTISARCRACRLERGMAFDARACERCEERRQS